MNNFSLLLKNKKIVAILAVFLILVIAVLVRWIWEKNFAGIIDVNIAPRAAKITLNGKQISAGKNYISPGKYTIKAEHSEFIERSIDFEIKAKEEKEILFALSTKDGTDTWYIRNRQDDLIRSGAGYKTISENMEKLKKNSPITKKLPYTDTLRNRFKISYEATEDTSRIKNLVIEINSCYNAQSSIDSEEYRKSRAQKWLDQNFEEKEKDKYEIKYEIKPCVIN